MRIDVLGTAGEWAGIDPEGRTAVVIDVLRATSTIVTALANGARAILPTSSAEDALRVARSLGRDGVLLCGERQELPIEGFDLGNSPGEFRREVVEGRTLVLCTTNGTRALVSVTGTRETVVASFLNLRAVVEHLVRRGADPVFVCAGRDGLVTLEDFLCAGEAVTRLASLWERTTGRRRGEAARAPLELGDGALVAQALWGVWAPVRAETLAETAAGRSLMAKGFAADIEACARLDAVTVVPVLEGRRIVAARPERAEAKGA